MASLCLWADPTCGFQGMVLTSEDPPQFLQPHHELDPLRLSLHESLSGSVSGRTGRLGLNPSSCTTEKVTCGNFLIFLSSVFSSVKWDDNRVVEI